MNQNHTTALKILIENYSAEPQSLKCLIADINSDTYKERHDFKIALGNIALQDHYGRLGAPLKSQVNKPGTFSYSHPKTDEFEIGTGHKVSMRELERQARYYGRLDFKIMPGWNQMNTKQKIAAIDKSDIPIAVKAELIAPLLKEIQ